MAYGFGFFVQASLYALLFKGQFCYAQNTSSLQAVEVITKKYSLSQIGKKTEEIDSTTKDKFRYSSLADLLSLNSGVFIKNYGPGALSSTSFRGGNASQTAILWNGFNLQNAMLGQSDLALIPSVLFESVQLEYGGSSSLWGSGAVAGSIHLNNKSTFGQGYFSSTNLGAGSFGLMNASTQFQISKQKFISTTKLYASSSKNNFLYRDTLDKEQSLKHQHNANYDLNGLMQEFKFLINSKQILAINAWLNSNHRTLTNNEQASGGKSYQEDQALRLSANWTYLKGRYKSVVRGAMFKDVINYTDSLSGIFSRSHSQTFMLENENYFSWFKNHQFNFGISGNSSTANSNNYSSAKSLSKVSILAGNKFSFFKERLISYVSARLEYFSVGSLPLTGNASLEYKVFKGFSISANAAKVYRQPTLNELYWLPGGNINLKAEQGYTYEGNAAYQWQKRSFAFSVSAAAYSRIIHNWILWVPGENANPTPLNLQQVWSRGTETHWKLKYKKEKWQMALGVMSNYVLSTVQKSNLENDNTQNKQLIYTPRYTFNGNASLGFKNAELIYFQQYIGYRFTSSDNAAWLNPYQYSSLRFNAKLIQKKYLLILYAACNNLFNSNYTILAGRPMPLRNFELGLSLQTKK